MSSNFLCPPHQPLHEVEQACGAHSPPHVCSHGRGAPDKRASALPAAHPPGTVQPDTRAGGGGGDTATRTHPPASARNWYVNGILFNMVRLFVYFILIKVEGSCISAKHNGMIFLLQQRSNKDTLFTGRGPAVLAATVPAWLWPSPVPTAWRSRRAPGGHQE